MSGQGFAAGIRKFAAKSLDNAETVRRRIALEMFRRVVMRTPVDTGRARGNWELVKDQGAPTRSLEAGAGLPYGAVIAEIVAGVARTRPEEALVLENRLPYIRRLEYDGWSRQAPGGMVRITAAEFRGLVKVVVTEVTK